MRYGPHEQRLSLSPDGTVQIHARCAPDGHWSAAFDDHPEVTFGGNTALVAAKRLVRSVVGLDESTLRIVYCSDDVIPRAFADIPRRMIEQRSQPDFLGAVGQNGSTAELSVSLHSAEEDLDWRCSNGYAAERISLPLRLS